MPTYAYRCKDCAHAFDVYQSFSDDALTECPECSGTLRKVLSPVGVVFKGSGFYRNDSRGTGSSRSGGSSGSTSATQGESTSSTSSTSKESTGTSSSSGTSSGSTSSSAASSTTSGGSKAASS